MTPRLPVLLGEAPAIPGVGMGIDADLDVIEFKALLLQRFPQPRQVPRYDILHLVALGNHMGLDPALLHRQIDFNPPKFLRLQLDAHAAGFRISVDCHPIDHLVKNLTFGHRSVDRLPRGGFRCRWEGRRDWSPAGKSGPGTREVRRFGRLDVSVPGFPFQGKISLIDHAGRHGGRIGARGDDFRLRLYPGG